MTAELWILFGTFLVGGIAATTSWVQANNAIQSRKATEKARKAAELARDIALEHSSRVAEASERQAKAQEKANELEQETVKQRKLSAPPIWSQGKNIDGDLYHFLNSSGRTIIVVEAILTGDLGEARIDMKQELPARVEHGENFAIWVRRTSGTGVIRVKFDWHFENDETNMQFSDKGI